MAVTKIWKVTRSFSDPIDYVKNPEKTRNPAAEKSRQMLEDVIEYAANEDKTEQKFFVTGINCDRDHARDEFLMTLTRALRKITSIRRLRMRSALPLRRKSGATGSRWS